MATRPLTLRRPLASARQGSAGPLHHVDWVMVGLLAALSLVGALMVYSATRGPDEPYDTSFVVRQASYLVLGALAAVGVAAVDYRRIVDRAPLLYLGTLVLLLAVLFVGSARSGAQRWFQLGAFSLQPAELAKVAIILTVAYAATRYDGPVDLYRLGGLLALVAVPAGLVLIEPDLGTALVSCAIGLAMLVAAGVRGQHLALVGALVIALATAVLASGLLDQYQRDRLTVFASQDRPRTQDELRGAAWNLEQSKIAIGSGGVTGRGLFNGPQTRLGNVPEQHTDFIFTAVGEELGLLGAGGVLGLFGALVWRIWRIAQLARDQVGTLICVGVGAMVVVQVFQNVGMTMGIMPITGVPLPFLTYGGSSTLALFVGMGLVLNVHMRRFR